MSRFRKKPVVIEAMRYHGPRVDMLDESLALEAWLKARRMKGCKVPRYRGQSLFIHTLEGEMEASPGDWIICGTKGELYPCKPDIFANIYEPVE